MSKIILKGILFWDIPWKKNSYVYKEKYIDILTGGFCQQMHIKLATASWTFC